MSEKQKMKTIIEAFEKRGSYHGAGQELGYSNTNIRYYFGKHGILPVVTYNVTLIDKQTGKVIPRDVFLEGLDND